MKTGADLHRQDSAPPNWDPVWERIFREREWGKYPPEHVIRFVARTFGDVPDRKAVHLLDLGCGPGACTWFMAREGFAVSGIDGSATAIARTKTRLTGEALQAHLHVGNFASLPWPDSFFDAAVDNASLYATPIDNARQAVNEVSRVLKPHGFFLSAAFSDRTWGYGQGPEVEPGGFAQVSEGPLANKGFCRFLSQSQLASFYAPLEILSAETTSYSL